MLQRRSLPTLVAGLTLLSGCQVYDWVFQPDADREAEHLVFKVQQPSKADILFVIDNSKSMTEEQAALVASIDKLLLELAPQDTRYRIGITSTDAIGAEVGCTAADIFEGENKPGAIGNCANPAVVLRRPHDGALGRLLAAYDPAVFDVNAAWVNEVVARVAETVTVDPDLKTKLARVMPVSATAHPPEFADPAIFTTFTGEQGARWVIDRETIRLEACQTCACTTLDDANQTVCDANAACFASCADPIARIMVQAYFRANVNALWIGGSGWEEGLRAAALAVGIDARDTGTDSEGHPTALNPANSLVRLPGGANTFRTRDVDGNAMSGPWTRDEALLAVMFVSDEEDCSMPADLMGNRCIFEEGCGKDCTCAADAPTPALACDSTGPAWTPNPDWCPQPTGSMCYQPEVRQQLLAPSRFAQLLTLRKGIGSRVAVGVIGGLSQAGPTPELLDRDATPGSCTSSAEGPSEVCSCLQGEDPDNTLCDLWCQYTTDTTGSCTDAENIFCSALSGRRYVDFGNSFGRRTYESVCRAGSGQDFGDAMVKFSRIVTLACFELENVKPAAPSYIVVKRAAKADAEAGLPPTELPMRAEGSSQAGWYYNEVENKVCLTGIDRLIGDVYDIFVLAKDRYSK